MGRIRSLRLWIDLAAAGVLVAALAGCSGGGSGGGSGPAVPPPSGGGAATALNITITGVAINSPPVVSFTVGDQNGAPVTNLAAADLRFNIAKLMPNSDGQPTIWQNYINRAVSGAVQGTQERTAAGYAFGALVNQGNGGYVYTFATDIKNPTATSCPAPCTDADGKALDISYQPGLTHRVTIQQANSAYPHASGVYDFVPSGGGVVTRRDIVAPATCNSCHNELTAHGTRVDARLCVTCHNPGSWVAGKPNTTVDFKVLIHRIHYNNAGVALPSVVAGTPYVVNGTDFSAVTFPQDVRNCARCHSGTAGSASVTATAQGDNWKMQPNMAACGSCHDNVYFGTKPDPAKPYQKQAHSGGVMTDSSTCVICHAAGRYTDSKNIEVAHNFPARLEAAAAKFQYSIISVAPTGAGGKPVITFSVTDPTNANKPYDIKTDPHFTAIASGNSRLAISIGWTTADFANEGSGASYGQPVSINILGNAAVVAGSGGTYSVTSPVAVPAGQTGTLRVTIDGHPAGDVTAAGQFNDRLQVKSVFKDAAITGSVAARRAVVDIAKCDVCHSVLSLHGNNRTDEPQVCAVCHNPNATDASRRPVNAAGALTGGVDGKPEESIDFKTMVHAIHAGQKSNGGFREKGIVIYGFGGSVNDFSDVVFPGKLNDCTACHAGNSYQLTGVWDAPTANGILGNTTSTAASATDPADNLRITPTTSVCTACHDDLLTKQHVQDPFNGGKFSVTQAQINAGAPEQCSFCHGAGKALDVKTVHGVK
jgi:OmcA/MtrC family decaheme c-type cytochrome